MLDLINRRRSGYAGDERRRVGFDESLNSLNRVHEVDRQVKRLCMAACHVDEPCRGSHNGGQFQRPVQNHPVGSYDNPSALRHFRNPVLINRILRKIVAVRVHSQPMRTQVFGKVVFA